MAIAFGLFVIRFSAQPLLGVVSAMSRSISTDWLPAACIQEDWLSEPSMTLSVAFT